jgi:cholesterol transport system auxiliary component
VHDFGPLEAVAPEQADFPLRSVEVVPAPWLASNAMVYRLVHVQPTRRQAFKDNRWAAQPARLVELVLKRGCTPESRRSRRGCRLRVDLDEFYQRFDSSQASRGSIEARVALLAPRADQPLAVQAFTLDHVAPTPDAAGGCLHSERPPCSLIVTSATGCGALTGVSAQVCVPAAAPDFRDRQGLAGISIAWRRTP